MFNRGGWNPNWESFNQENKEKKEKANCDIIVSKYELKHADIDFGDLKVRHSASLHPL